MNGKHILITSALVALCGLYACNENVNKPTDTLGKGRTLISMDETFQPVMESQVQVFETNNPEADIVATYKPENACFQDLFGDSVRLIIATRPPNAEEVKAGEARKIIFDAVPIARDAIAVVLNKDNTDSNISIEQLQGILTGTFSKKYTVVFDNQGSSTVRFIQDSILKGTPLGTNVFAAKSNPDVVDYVSKNKDAIGFVGLSYVSDTGDSVNEAFLGKIKLASLFNEQKQDFFQPYQAYIATKDYPLTRTLYYVSREHYPGLATGFANFIGKDRGQLIFSKFRLFPLRMNVIIREAAVNN